ncbi:MAG: IS5 family transposase [Brevundimonas sp.]|nr:IS5 family transposase [Brevundimonas sp.]
MAGAAKASSTTSSRPWPATAASTPAPPSTALRSRPTARRRALKGAFVQSIGRSRGGRTTKIHGLVDDHGRPRVLLLSAGNTNDITMAHALIEAAGPFRKLLADRGHDVDHLRKRLAERSAEAVIPTTTSRRRPIPYDVVAYRQRKTVERLWAKLKDYRRAATRYDTLSANYLSGVLIAAAVCYWAK